MNRSEELIRFLVRKKIPLRVAMEILQQAEKILTEKWKPEEKAVEQRYETR